MTLIGSTWNASELAHQRRRCGVDVLHERASKSDELASRSRRDGTAAPTVRVQQPLAEVVRRLQKKETRLCSSLTRAALTWGIITSRQVEKAMRESALDTTVGDLGRQRLRALVVFDEVYGFLPPHPANPPTKRPLVALMK